MTERPTIRVTTIECETYVNIDDVVDFIKKTVEEFAALAPKPSEGALIEQGLYKVCVQTTKNTGKGLCRMILQATREYEESIQP